jgi:hypothetical protein
MALKSPPATRVCAYRQCDILLASTAHYQKFCSTDHKIKEHALLRQEKIDATRLVMNSTLVYEDYKEPLKAIEKGKGFGYYGTVALSADKTLVQCHICGNLYTTLNPHIIRTHKTSVNDYKDQFQLARGTALISEPMRERLQANAIERKQGAIGAEYMQKSFQSGTPRQTRKGMKLSLEAHNKRGSCPDQLLEKIKVLATILDKTPTEKEFIAHYQQRYIGQVKRVYGTFVNAVHKAGLVSRDELRRPSKDQLIQELQDFHKQYGRIPMMSDFKRGLLRTYDTYVGAFGTLNNARIEAGLNAVLPLGFGRMLEVTPEQYLRYKAGDPLHELFSKPAPKQPERVKLL